MFREANTRDRAILAFLLDTGCRAGGVVALKIADVDLVEKRAFVTEKGDKTRVVIFTSFTADCLRAWLEERQSGAPTFFHSRTLEPLTPSGLYQVLRRLGQQARVKGRFHTFAREYLRNNGIASWGDRADRNYQRAG